jgi:DNA-directed RNA polymerase specialized sigma24 family protein
MSSGYVIPVDPAELANRFASHDTLLDDEVPEELPEDSMAALFSSGDYETRVAPLLDRIPEREADLIYLYYVCKKRQADIAEIFDVTQAAISYRLDRGIQRIKFLLAIPTVTEEELRADLEDIFEAIDINILVGMWQTTCQSEVANMLNLTQGRVRHRFFKAVERLKGHAEADEKYRPYEKIFSSISSKKFNILRAVSLPQWANRGVDRCL